MIAFIVFVFTNQKTSKENLICFLTELELSAPTIYINISKRPSSYTLTHPGISMFSNSNSFVCELVNYFFEIGQIINQNKCHSSLFNCQYFWQQLQ